MGKSNVTSSKKEREKKKQRDRKNKMEKRADRKANKGQSFEQMIAYVDEFGRLSSTPPVLPQKIKQEDIQIGVAKQLPPDAAELIRTGVVSFFNESKGYGFIKDAVTQESIFVHASALSGEIKERDKVTFEVEKGPKGMYAVNIKPAV